MQTVDEWLSARGWPRPADMPMYALEAVELYEGWGDSERAALASRGWLWSFDNDYFDQVGGPDGFYARELRHIFERAEVGVDRVSNYFGDHDGALGVLVRVQYAGEDLCLFKRTDGFNDICHCDVLFAAASVVLEAADVDLVLSLLEEDVVVELSLMPREISHAALTRLEARPRTPQVRGEPCRRISTEEAQLIMS